MSEDENPVSEKLDSINYTLEEVRGRYTLLQYSHTDEVDDQFKATIEEDFGFLLSLVDNALDKNPEALIHD